MRVGCGYSERQPVSEVKSDPVLSIVLSAMSILIVDASAATSPERSVSPSEQFVIYGADAAWRGAVSDLAERTKADLLALLRRRDQWTIAAVINLQARAANLPEIPDSELRFSQTGSGLKLQLDLMISREMNLGAMEREILRVILLEMIYRKQPAIASGESYVEPPDWLVEGVLASSSKGDRLLLIGALSAAGQVTPLDQFLGERIELLDPAGRIVYRAYSLALLQLLIETENGRARLGRYIDHLAFASNDALVDLRAAFPQLAKNDFERLWRTQIAAMKTSARTDLLTFSQTNEKLDELLQRKFETSESHAKSLSFEALCQKKLTSSQRSGLQKLAQELMLLATTANPALRPIVEDYQQLIAQAVLGKNHAVAGRLSELKILRTKLAARMSEVDDYMNWFEATQLETASGLFDNVRATAADPAGTIHHRKDAFSTYLDAMESEF